MFEVYTSDTYAGNFSHADGGPRRGSHVHRTGSVDPKQCDWKLV